MLFSLKHNASVQLRHLLINHSAQLRCIPGTYRTHKVKWKTPCPKKRAAKIVIPLWSIQRLAWFTNIAAPTSIIKNKKFPTAWQWIVRTSRQDVKPTQNKISSEIEKLLARFGREGEPLNQTLFAQNVSVQSITATAQHSLCAWTQAEYCYHKMPKSGRRYIRTYGISRELNDVCTQHDFIINNYNHIVFAL